jgi:hypothetical protein
MRPFNSSGTAALWPPDCGGVERVFLASWGGGGKAVLHEMRRTRNDLFLFCSVCTHFSQDLVALVVIRVDINFTRFPEFGKGPRVMGCKSMQHV